MENLTFETMKALKSAGFTYPEYEHFLNYGMVYYYLGKEYTIGGCWDADFSKQDELIAREGCWLPDESQLCTWLVACDFSYQIQWDNKQRYFHVEIIDEVTGAQYHGGGITLVNALAKGILKICKSGLRCYSTDGFM